MIELEGDFTPVEGKYYDLIQKDWESGLITFIDEVLFMFTKNKIKLRVYSSDRDVSIYIEDKNYVNIFLPPETQLGLKLLKHPKIEIDEWPCSRECENLSIKQLQYEYDFYMAKSIKNCDIDTFDINTDMDLLDCIEHTYKYLKSFDLSQVKNFKLNYNSYSSKCLKFLLFRGCNVIARCKFYHGKLMELVCYFLSLKIHLLDSTLFQDIEAYIDFWE